MKLSKFNLWVKDYPEHGQWLVFNSRTQALIKIDDDFKRSLDSLDRGSADCGGLRVRENLEPLKQNGIVVEDDNDEARKLSDFFRQLKHESGRQLSFEATILTTFNCNFRCVYCFEESVKEKKYLDNDTADRISSWLIKHAEERMLKRIYVVYYGGEPLLNTRPILDISRRLKAWAGADRSAFRFSVITNGSLITPALVDELLPLGLDEFRISLDGDRQAHNRNRPFIDGRDSFDCIVGNIKKVIDKVKVGVNGNFDRVNFESIKPLLDYLESEGILHKLSMVNFNPIIPRLGPKANPSSIEMGECLTYFTKDGLAKEIISIKKELLSRGVNINSGLGINSCPLVMRDAGVTIDPDGNVYVCNSLIGYPEFCVGNVRAQEFLPLREEFFNIDAWGKCPGDCPYIPMCQGGCRFFSFLENNDFTSLSCKRGYFDMLSPELIKLEYDNLRLKMDKEKR